MYIYIYTIILSRDIEIHVCIYIYIFFIYVCAYIYIYYLIIYSYMPLPDIYDGIVVLCGSIGPESFASVQPAHLTACKHCHWPSAKGASSHQLNSASGGPQMPSAAAWELSFLRISSGILKATWQASLAWHATQSIGSGRRNTQESRQNNEHEL